MAPEKGNRIKVEDDGVDPDRPVPEEFAEGSVPSPAEDEDPPRLRVLQGRQVGEEFRLRSPALEGEGVVRKDGDLSGENRRGDPSVGRVPCHDKPRVVPARHPPVEGGRLIEDGDQEDREERGDGPAGPAPFPGKRKRAAAAAIRPQATARGKFWTPYRRQIVASTPPARLPALSIP